MRGHNAHSNLRVGSSASDSVHCDDIYLPCGAEVFVTSPSDKLLNLVATASVSCHLDGLGKTAHVNKNSLDVPNLEETWCAVARGIRLRSRTLGAHCHARSSEGRFKYRRTFRAVDMCARGS